MDESKRFAGTLALPSSLPSASLLTSAAAIICLFTTLALGLNVQIQPQA